MKGLDNEDKQVMTDAIAKMEPVEGCEKKGDVVVKATNCEEVLCSSIQDGHDNACQGQKYCGN